MLSVLPIILLLILLLLLLLLFGLVLKCDSQGLTVIRIGLLLSLLRLRLTGEITTTIRVTAHNESSSWSLAFEATSLRSRTNGTKARSRCTLRFRFIRQIATYTLRSYSGFAWLSCECGRTLHRRLVDGFSTSTQSRSSQVLVRGLE